MNICDTHTDFLTEIKFKKERERYIKKIKNKINIILCAVFTTNKKINIFDIKNYKKEIEKYNKKYNLNLILSIEDLGFIKSEKEIKELIKLKPISATLTWNEKNQFAGGSNSKKGLTKLGIKTIKLLEENNILVDTAHLSRKAFWQLTKITTKPIFNSHANIDELFSYQRNLTHFQIKKIVESNGFLGITVYQNFISKEKITCRDIALQFDYLIKKYGYKNFGLGTDLFGFEKKFLPSDFDSYLNIETLAEELKKLNHSQQVVDAILWKNFEDFLKRNKLC